MEKQPSSIVLSTETVVSYGKMDSTGNKSVTISFKIDIPEVVHFDFLGFELTWEQAQVLYEELGKHFEFIRRHDNG